MAVATAIGIGTVATVGAAISDRKSAGDALDAQTAQNARNEAFIAKQAQQARKDLIPLFNAAQNNLRLGAQSALDVFGQTLPRQQNVFRAGNIEAQKQIIAGLPQIQNAILGREVDLSALQPKGVSVDQPFIHQTAPQVQKPNLDHQARALQNAAALGGQADQGGINVPEGLRGLTREQIIELNRLQSTGALGGGGFNLP